MKQINSLIFICVSGYQFGSAFVPVLPDKCSNAPLSMSKKNSGRARVEKNLEDMMDNDWRFFRARLVAQENAEKQEAKANKAYNTYEATPTETDEKKARQEKIGNIFAGLFNSQEKKRPKSIFNGDGVGGATSRSMIPDSCEDPFLSFGEIPVLLKPKVTLDKLRWAHPIEHIESGCVLIANEKLGGVFHQTVILIIDHNEVSGSTGIVINRPLNGDLLKVASDSASNVDSSLKMAFSTASVTYGGPVMDEEFSLLHGYAEVDGSKKVAPGVFVGGSEELMNEVRKHNLDPKDALFVKGHAAWVPNQLSREISKGVWYVASCSSDFILRYAGGSISNENKDDLWADILTCMGGQYADLATQYIGKGDRRAMP